MPKFNPEHHIGNENINIAFCFDNNLWRQATVAITSLLRNSPKVYYDIYCVTDTNKEQLLIIEGLVKKFSPKSNISFFKPNHDFDNAKRGNWALAVYYRCMLPILLTHLDKVIYSDTDVIFLSDLVDVDSINIKNNLLAGCTDWIGGNTDYINSGFMVMNLKEMRKNGFYERMVTESKEKSYTYPDQDLLNALAKGKIKLISNIYNFRPRFLFSGLKYIKRDEYNKLKRSVMLHYIQIKPWDIGAKFPTTEIWRKYAKDTGLF